MEADISRLVHDSLSNLLVCFSSNRRCKVADRFTHSLQWHSLATYQVKIRLQEPLQAGLISDTAQYSGNDKLARYSSELNSTTIYFQFFTLT